jgi:hypothetical protein
MRSAAAKDDRHAFWDSRPGVEGPQVGAGALFPSLDRLTGNLVLIRRASEDSPGQRLVGPANPRDLDHYLLVRVKALDGRDAIG